VTPAPARVVAVVVSHQRRELLGRCLEAVAAQTRACDAVVVVDNASTDGAPDLVRQRFAGVDLVELGRNTGGAGGFAAGMARALQRHDADLLWLMDDDTVPRPDALAELLACREGHPGRPVLVASRVLWSDGTEHPMNTPRRRPGASAQEIADAELVDAVPVRSASFVSLLVDAAATRRAGLPLADFFLWNDDFEFTTRLLRNGAGLASRRSTVDHLSARRGASDDDPGERFYFEVRNKLWTFTRSAGLRPPERLLYLGSTVVRWGRTMARSSDRGLLLRAAARGARDGVRGPRGTAAVLAGLGDVSVDVEAVDRGDARG